MSSNDLPIVIILVGIPGSGKTTFRKKFINNNPQFKYICPDEIREEVTGDISNISQDRKVWELAYSKFKEYIDNKIDVIFDATNINPTTRYKIEGIAKDLNNCNLFYKIFEVSPMIAKERIKKDLMAGINRSKVPPEIVDKMYQNFQKEINYIKQHKNILDI